MTPKGFVEIECKIASSPSCTIIHATL